MNEKDLNIKYIREKTGLVENDELIPIILEMIQESYKAGLCQAEYDNTMGLVEENKQLKDLIVEKNNQLKDIQNKHKDYTEVNILQMKLEASEKARKEAIELVKNNQRKDEFVELNEWQARDLINILEEVE